MEIADLIPHSPATHRLCNQLVGAGTSIGANLEEADGSITKRDFLNKVAIARKEAKETKYWLRLIESKYLRNGLVSADIGEVQEIINILSAIISKTKG